MKNIRGDSNLNNLGAGVVWVLLLLSFPAILLADLYLTPWKIPSTVIYAVPIMVASRFLGKTAGTIALLIALPVEVVDGLLERQDTATVTLSALALALIGLLSLVWSEADKRAASLAAERSLLYERERQRSEELNASHQRLQQFFSVVSHDLLNQMTTFAIVSSMLPRWDTIKTRERDQLASTLNSASKVVMRLANDLLDASRIGSGRLEISRTRCDMVELVRTAVEQRQATTTRHRLVVEARPQRIEGLWDQDRMAQALGNLLDNAIKYSPDGGEILVTIDRTNGTVRVTVSDQGLGIAPEDIPLVFQPYSRLHQEVAIKGTGLGLYIVKGIVEAHQGTIKLESKPGKGSTFFAELPLIA